MAEKWPEILVKWPTLTFVIFVSDRSLCKRLLFWYTANIYNHIPIKLLLFVESQFPSAKELYFGWNIAIKVTNHFLVRSLFGSCPFWFVLFLVRALFGSCCFWFVHFLVCAVFGLCCFWFVPFSNHAFFLFVLFLVRTLFGSCPFWFLPFLVCAVFNSCPFWFVPF